MSCDCSANIFAHHCYNYNYQYNQMLHHYNTTTTSSSTTSTSTMNKKLPLQHSTIRKHAPPSAFSHATSASLFKLKTSTPFVLAVKQISKLLAAIDSNTTKAKGRNRGRNISKQRSVVVVGLQRVLPRLLQIAVYFEERNHKVEIRTTTVKTVDEFQKQRSSNDSANTNQQTKPEPVLTSQQSIASFDGEEDELLLLLLPPRFLNESSDEDDTGETTMRVREIAGLQVTIHVRNG